MSLVRICLSMAERHILACERFSSGFQIITDGNCVVDNVKDGEPYEK